MSVPIAYLAIVLIWSTTPLAIKWSGEGPGFLFGVFGRMTLGALLCLAIMRMLGQGLPWHKEARYTYGAAAIGTYGAMLCVYWGAQYIPSGVIAVLFGLTPIFTALFAWVILNEKGFAPAKIVGMALGVIGLSVIFKFGSSLGEQTAAGLAMVLCSVILHSTSIVFVKRLNGSLSGLTVTTGALLVAVPLYFITWLVLDGSPPSDLPAPAVLSIVYLSIFGSVVGFSLFYYVLKHVEANAVALITLISPVLALVIGHTINQEHIGLEIWAGAALVLSGLAIHQWGGLVTRRMAAIALRGK